MGIVGNILEGTFVLILFYLILSNALGFGLVVGALGGNYVSAVKVLQAR